MASHSKRSFEAASENSEPPGKKQKVLSREDIIKRDREIALKTFFLDLKGYGSTVPGEATKVYLQKGGLSTSNEQIVTLMSLAVDHAIASIVRDCQLWRTLRLQRVGENEAESFQGGKMLTGEDLAMSLGERGMDVKDSATITRCAGTAAIAASAEDNGS